MLGSSVLFRHPCRFWDTSSIFYLIPDSFLNVVNLELQTLIFRRLLILYKRRKYLKYLWKFECNWKIFRNSYRVKWGMFKAKLPYYPFRINYECDWSSLTNSKTKVTKGPVFGYCCNFCYRICWTSRKVAE